MPKKEILVKDEGSHSPTGMTETDSSTSSEDAGSEDAFDPTADEEEVVEEEDEDEDEDEEMDSDNLDDDEDDDDRKKRRKRASNGGGSRAKTTQSQGKVEGKKSKGKKEIVEGYEDEDDEPDHDVELEDGQEIAGRIYPAPKTGQGEFVLCDIELRCSSRWSDIEEHVSVPQKPADTREE